MTHAKRNSYPENIYRLSLSFSGFVRIHQPTFKAITFAAVPNKIKHNSMTIYFPSDFLLYTQWLWLPLQWLGLHFSCRIAELWRNKRISNQSIEWIKILIQLLNDEDKILSGLFSLISFNKFVCFSIDLAVFSFIVAESGVFFKKKRKEKLISSLKSPNEFIWKTSLQWKLNGNLLDKLLCTRRWEGKKGWKENSFGC